MFFLSCLWHFTCFFFSFWTWMFVTLHEQGRAKVVRQKSDKVGVGTCSIQFVECKWNCHRKQSDMHKRYKRPSKRMVQPQFSLIGPSEITAELLSLRYSACTLRFCVGESVWTGTSRYQFFSISGHHVVIIKILDCIGIFNLYLPWDHRLWVNTSTIWILLINFKPFFIDRGKKVQDKFWTVIIRFWNWKFIWKKYGKNRIIFESRISIFREWKI